MGSRLPPERYRELVDRLHERIRLHVPPKSVVLIASRGDEDIVHLEGYRVWHFPRTDGGVYGGHHPADSAAAIAHLRHLQAQGAQYLVFPSTGFWWFDHYRDFAIHLKTAHTPAFSDNDVCAIFELDEPAGSSQDTPLLEAADSQDPGRDATAGPPPMRVALPSRRRVPRLLTILARFGTDQYPRADAEVAEIVARQMPGVERTQVVVDNALARSSVVERPEGVVIGGDNRAREFSAFDRGLEFVGGDIWSYDLVHFATSAFKTLYTAYLDRFDAELVASIAGRPVSVGHIDCYNEPVDVLTFRSQHWMRTCFFILPPEEARGLGRFVSVADGREFFSGDAAAPFRADAPISPNYREYLTTWLTGGDIGQGVAWHSSFSLTRETLPVFEHKALSIINEHLLGIRLRALGCRLVDVTWLSTMLRQHGTTEIAWDTPWREQLANRDADARRMPADRHLTVASLTA
jgi:hypothetical protein